MLARSLPAAVFGTAVLLFAAMLLLNTVHASLVVYPLSVEGAQLSDGPFRVYVAGSLGSALILSVPMCLALGAVAGVLDTAATAVWVALGLAAWQMQETIRRALFSRFRQRDAIPGDLLSYMGQAAVIGILGLANHVTLPLVFVGMTASSVVGGAVQLLAIRPVGPEVRAVLRQALDGASQGRWALPSNMVGAVIMQLPIWMVALVVARAAAGEFQALVIVVGGMNPIMFGLANLLTPAVAQDRAASSWASFRRVLAATSIPGGVLLVVYDLVLLLWPGQILGVMYGHSSPYVDLTLPLRLLAVAYLLVSLVHVGNAVLLGLKRSRDVLTVQLSGALTLLVVGVPWLAAWGVTGAAAAAIVVHFARAIACARGVSQALRKSTVQPVVLMGR